MEIKDMLKLLLLVPFMAFSQHKVPVPKDLFNTPIYGGNGTPILESVTVTSTSYGTHVITLSTSGDNAQRNYRNISVYNADTTASVVVCFSNSATTCTVNSILVSPVTKLVFDQLLFGPNNNIGYIHLKQTGGSSAAVNLMYW